MIRKCCIRKVINISQQNVFSFSLYDSYSETMFSNWTSSTLLLGIRSEALPDIFNTVAQKIDSATRVQTTLGLMKEGGKKIELSRIPISFGAGQSRWVASMGGGNYILSTQLSVTMTFDDMT